MTSFNANPKLILVSLSWIMMYLFPVDLQSQTPLVNYTEVLNLGAVSPIDIVNPYDGTDRLFIVERAGRIRVYAGGVISSTVFLDLSLTGLISTSGERGLLSLAFAPNYSTSGYFFIYYTNSAGSIEIARYQRSVINPDIADAGSAKIVITIPHPTYSNHNGGKLNFGSDGYLYFATGDGGFMNDPSGNAQNGNELLGKMLRLNVNTLNDVAPWYTIPPDNPYITDGAVRDEILALGLRNPFRWSFDRMGSGPWDMWIADVGQDQWEEVNFTSGSITKSNFGWRCFEGNHDNTAVADCNPPDYIPPVFEYDHSSNGGHSITGGMVYRGSAYPALQGWYICIDYLNPNGWVVKPGVAGAFISNRQSGLPLNITSFAEDINREMYAIALNGILYRVGLSGVLPVKLKSFFAVSKNGMHEISWETASEQNLQSFEVQAGTDGIHFTTIGILTPVNNENGYRYLFNYPEQESGKIYYRLLIRDLNGKTEYSGIFKLDVNYRDAAYITPTLVQNGRVNIRLNKPFKSLQVIDMNGKVRKQRQLNQTSGVINLDVTDLSKGMYIIRLFGGDREIQRKITIM